MKKTFGLLLCASILFTSCEKEIDIDLNSSDPQLVIEANITDEPGPYFVKISKTVNFSDGNDYPPVTGAFVTIADNLGTIDTLTELTPGLYQTTSLTGQPGVTYSLTVNVAGKTYSATSVMPQQVNMDTLAFSTFPGPGGNNTYICIPVFTDPLTYGNNYRFILTVNGEKGKSYIVFNDNATNGTINQRPAFDQELEIGMGDTVSLEMQCIDVATYDYFYTLSQIAGNGPGGGTTPSNPPNNITGDQALGYFSAHPVQKRTQVVQ